MRDGTVASIVARQYFYSSLLRREFPFQEKAEVVYAEENTLVYKERAGNRGGENKNEGRPPEMGRSLELPYVCPNPCMNMRVETVYSIYTGLRQTPSPCKINRRKGR